MMAEFKTHTVFVWTLSPEEDATVQNALQNWADPVAVRLLQSRAGVATFPAAPAAPTPVAAPVDENDPRAQEAERMRSVWNTEQAMANQVPPKKPQIVPKKKK
jgi:hypothetical protein